jgi:DeoR family fructose operon transcriptional repressor
MMSVRATDDFFFSEKRKHGESFDLTSPEALKHDANKQQIVRAAFDCIEDGDTIALDAGALTTGLAWLIGKRSYLTVVTNNFLIARILESAETVNTILLGGTVLKGFHCTVNNRTSGAPPRLSVDKAFITANNFSFRDGATTHDIQQAKAKKAIMAMSSRVYLLCDSTKPGKDVSAQFAGSSEIQALITDRISSIESHTLQKQGIEVIVAGPLTKRPRRLSSVGGKRRSRQI